MVSGVVPMVQGGQGSGLNVKGACSDSTNDSVDGFNNRPSRGAAAMQEFKMGVVGFSAETGRMASGNSNRVLRDNIFAARSFFVQQKQSLRHN